MQRKLSASLFLGGLILLGAGCTKIDSNSEISTNLPASESSTTSTAEQQFTSTGNHTYSGEVVVSGQYYFDIFLSNVCFIPDDNSRGLIPEIGEKGTSGGEFCFVNSQESARLLFGASVEELAESVQVGKMTEETKYNATIRIKNYSVENGESGVFTRTTLTAVISR